MKHISFILFLIFVPLITYSQSSFTRRYVAQLPDRFFFMDVDTCANGFIILGCRADSLLGSTAFTLMRTDSVGIPIWSNYYQTPTLSAIRPTQVATGQDGFFVVGQEGFVTKIDFAGNVVWAVNSQGVYSNVASTPDSGCIAICAGMLIVKYDKLGNLMWHKHYAGDIGGIKLNGNGYLIYGRKDNYSNYYHPFLSALDSVGNIIWYDRFLIFGNIPPFTPFIEDAISTTDGGYVLATDQYGCIKVDHNGVYKWGYHYQGFGGLEYRQVTSTSDNSVIVATGVTPHLIKIDSMGSVIYNKFILSDSIAIWSMRNIAPDKYAFVTSGIFSATQNMLVVFDSSLVYPCTDSLVGSSPQPLIITSIISSVMSLNTPLAVNTFVLNMQPVTQVTYDGCSGQWLSLPNTSAPQNNEIKIFPNPFSESTTIEIPGNSNTRFRFELYDINGKIIRSSFFSGNRVVLMREDLSAGMYFYRVFSEEKFLGKGKMVVE